MMGDDKVFVVELRADDYMRLRAVRLELPPEGGMTVVGGNNGAGKSTVLSVVEAALAGKKAIPSEPVRKGADKGAVAVTLSDGLTVERTFTAAGGTALKVSKDGMRASSPQGRLDELLGPLSFDPLAFDRMRDGDKAETLRRAMGLDLSDLDAGRKQAYDGRTDVGRTIKQMEGELAGLPPADPNCPDEEPDLAVLTAALTDAQQRMTAWAQAKSDVLRAEQRIGALEQELAQLRTYVDMRLQACSGLAPDTEAEQAAVRQAGELGARVRAKQSRRRLEDRLTELRQQKHAFSNAIDGLDAERERRIAACDLPVPGLGFDPESGAPTLDGLPWSQASQAQRLKAALAVAGAMDPALRIVLIREGNDLDDANLRLVAEWAREHDMHVLLERVHVDGMTGVVIEDGEALIPQKSKPRMKLPGSGA